MAAPNSRYEMLRPLARGGMGEIWLAVLRGAAGFEKRVVLKRVLSHLDDDPEFLTRFIDEARIAASLSHANIVAVSDLGEDDEGFFLAMEWVDGWDLRRLLRTLAAEGERLPDELALFFAAELAAALAYAHARTADDGTPLHIVHRDISPSNVLVSRAGDVKLTDFGIASAQQRLGRTATGQLRGKFAYMSPEQASGGAVDARSDLFALGALLFEMLAGRKAFDAAGDIETLDQVRAGDRPELAELRPDLAEDVVAVVERAMAMEPEERFADAAELESALRALLSAHWGVVGRRELTGWLSQRLAQDPLFRAQDRPGGASLDDILAAQLDGGLDTGRSATASGLRPRDPSATGSVRSRSVVPAARSGRRPAAVVGGHTMTRAEVPRRRRRNGARIAATVVLVGVVALGVLAAFWPSAPRLVVQTVPSGAQVYVDGVPFGISDLRTDLEVGTHEVLVRLPGYAEENRVVDSERGGVVELDIPLVPLDRPVVFHSVPPGAVVTVDGVEILAGNSLPVPVGRALRVQMELEGFAPLDEEVVFRESDSVFTRRLSALEAPAAEVEPVAVADPPTERPRPPHRDSGDERPVAASSANDAAVRQPDGGNASASDPAAEPGTLIVRFVDPPLVGDITIDGRAMGSNNDLRMEFQLAPGPHTIRVDNAAAAVGYETRVALSSGGEEAVTVEWR